LGATGVAVDSAGNVLVADQRDYRVLVIAARPGAYYGLKLRAGYLYSVAGNGRYLDSGDGGPATSAELEPSGVAEDRSADLVVVTDGSFSANVIRVVPGRTGTFFGRRMTAGLIYTIAGNRKRGYAGDSGPGTKARLSGPSGVTADQAGNVLVADGDNLRVRVVADKTGTYYGRTMKAGYIYTIAGDGNPVYLGDGGPATAAGIVPTYPTVDHAGNVLITDQGGSPYGIAVPRVVVVAEKTDTYYGQQMTAGDIYTIAGDGSPVYFGDGGPAVAAGLDPWGTAIDSAGNVVIGDMTNNRLRVVAEKTGTYYGQRMKAGNIYTIAGDGKRGTSGDGAPAISAELDGAASPVIDSAGNIAVAGATDRLVAEKNGTYYGQRMKAGNIYTIASIYFPSLAVSYAGNLLVADDYANRVLSVER
jgi:internalin A